MFLILRQQSEFDAAPGSHLAVVDLPGVSRSFSMPLWRRSITKERSTSFFGSPAILRMMIHGVSGLNPACLIACRTMISGCGDSMTTPCTFSFHRTTTPSS